MPAAEQGVMFSMSLNATIEEASELMNAIDENMDGLIVPGEIRARLFFGLIHLSLEHYGSIIVLVKNKLSASAAALLRAQFEAMIRALYFQECASEDEVVSFTDGKNPISLKKMIDKLELQLKDTGLSFLKYYENTGKLLHGFTHGGFEQIGRRYSDSDLINNFDDKEIETIITNSKVLACLSASCAAGIAGKDDLALEFISKYGNNKNET